MNIDPNEAPNILLKAWSSHTKMLMIEELDTCIFLLNLATLAIRKAESKANTISSNEKVDLSPLQTQIQDVISGLESKMTEVQGKL